MSFSPRVIRLVFYSAILLCVVAVQYTAKSSVLANRDALAVIPHTLTGNIRLHTGFYSRLLQSSRSIILYLPPDYQTNESRRYAVLYMLDGQNIFDASSSFFNHRERHMDEVAQKLITTHAIQPLIIVGVYSDELNRINEYTPTHLPGSYKGGQADQYGRMLVEEIKPFIDENYRTLRDRRHTGLGGASLGGLATLYLGFRYQKVFGMLSVTSPAASWDNGMILRYVESMPSKSAQKISLSVGSDEPDDFLEDARILRQELINKGWREGLDLSYLEAAGAGHTPDEASERVSHLLKFLFAK